MAIPYTAGPAYFYVAIGQQQNPGSYNPSTQTPSFLGTCESAPRIQHTPRFSPVMNDIAGDQEPYDESYQGKSGLIFGDLTVWNWNVLSALFNRPATVGAAAGATADGVDPVGAVGSLMITEGLAYTLWVQFPYAAGAQAHAVFAAGGMVPGYRYQAAWLVGPDEIDPGTKPNKVHVQFRARRAYNPTSGAFILYDHNMAVLPAFPPTTVNG
jgi:hypothetical protein